MRPRFALALAIAFALPACDDAETDSADGIGDSFSEESSGGDEAPALTMLEQACEDALDCMYTDCSSEVNEYRKCAEGTDDPSQFCGVASDALDECSSSCRGACDEAAGCEAAETQGVCVAKQCADPNSTCLESPQRCDVDNSTPVPSC